MSEIVFEAGCAAELVELLERWGASAPRRLERRGKQKELDRWIANRLLVHLMRLGCLKFPLALQEQKAPDFMLFLGPDRTKIGLEVTEACDPKEQARKTGDARRATEEETSVLREVDLMDPQRPANFKKLVEEVITKKSKKNYERPCMLAVYPNTDACAFEKKAWWDKALDEHSADLTSFDGVWIVNTENCVQLKKLVDL